MILCFQAPPQGKVMVLLRRSDFERRFWDSEEPDTGSIWLSGRYAWQNLTGHILS